MSAQTLKLGDIVVNKKQFYASKQAIALNLVDTDKIVVADKFKFSDKGSKYFIGYMMMMNLDPCVLYYLK